LKLPKDLNTECISSVKMLEFKSRSRKTSILDESRFFVCQITNCGEKLLEESTQKGILICHINCKSKDPQEILVEKYNVRICE